MKQHEVSIDSSKMTAADRQRYEADKMISMKYSETEQDIENAMAGFVTEADGERAKRMSDRGALRIATICRFAVIAAVRLDDAKTDDRQGLDLMELNSRIREMAELVGGTFSAGAKARARCPLAFRVLDTMTTAAEIWGRCDTANINDLLKARLFGEIKNLAWSAGGRMI